MIRESAFRQKGVYTNRVRMSAQNRRMYEKSSDMSELDATRPIEVRFYLCIKVT